MRGRVTLSAAVAVALTLGAAALASSTASPPPLATGLFDPAAFSNVNRPDAAVGWVRAKAAGVSVVRLVVHWDKIERVHPPTPDKARDPSFAGYDWKSIDG